MYFALARCGVCVPYCRWRFFFFCAWSLQEYDLIMRPFVVSVFSFFLLCFPCCNVDLFTCFTVVLLLVFALAAVVVYGIFSCYHVSVFVVLSSISSLPLLLAQIPLRSPLCLLWAYLLMCRFSLVLRTSTYVHPLPFVILLALLACSPDLTH